MYLHNVIWSGTDTNKVLCSHSVYILFQEDVIYYHLLHKTKQHLFHAASVWYTFMKNSYAIV